MVISVIILIIGIIIFYKCVFRKKEKTNISTTKTNKDQKIIDNKIEEEEEYFDEDYYELFSNEELEVEKAIEIDSIKAVQIYRKCLEKNIFTIEENQESLEIIAYSYGIDDIELAKKYFLHGEVLVANHIIETKKQKEKEHFENIKNSDNNKYEEAKSTANIKGREKYLYSLKKDLEIGYKTLEFSKHAEKMGLSNMNATVRKTDWAIWGGIANGIAGPGAAIATVMDINRRNMEAEQNISSVRESGRNLYQEAKRIQNNLPTALAKEEQMKKYFEDRLFDDKNQIEKMNLLNINNIEYSITDAKNFEVKAKYKNIGDITIIDSPAILDGSLKIEVYDTNNNMVANGYYCAPGIEKFNLNYKGKDRFDLNYSGFYGCGEINSICISHNYETIDKNKKYRIEIKPNYLWIIEK